MRDQEEIVGKGLEKSPSVKSTSKNIKAKDSTTLLSLFWFGSIFYDPFEIKKSNAPKKNQSIINRI